MAAAALARAPRLRRPRRQRAPSPHAAQRQRARQRHDQDARRDHRVAEHGPGQRADAGSSQGRPRHGTVAAHWR
jgi:hypothetical protein